MTSHGEERITDEIVKEWLDGRRHSFPPAYGGCSCACHHSAMLHYVPCCYPSDEDINHMGAEVRKGQGR